MTGASRLFGLQSVLPEEEIDPCSADAKGSRNLEGVAALVMVGATNAWIYALAHHVSAPKGAPYAPPA